jgi:hypothetical protein
LGAILDIEFLEREVHSIFHRHIEMNRWSLPWTVRRFVAAGRINPIRTSLPNVLVFTFDHKALRQCSTRPRPLINLSRLKYSSRINLQRMPAAHSIPRTITPLINLSRLKYNSRINLQRMPAAHSIPHTITAHVAWSAKGLSTFAYGASIFHTPYATPYASICGVWIRLPYGRSY